ncbi:hypothetical protein C5S35_00980 [Candidatus Methanophagaceae archaeon]|nr:hypothetical protein C5S35_00980 [Methanophagales archaeon]
MNTNKIALLAIAIVAIGIFALPSTVSLLSGQHTWYDLSGDGNNLPCEKCHADINDEMISDDNGVHRTLAGPGCDCHRVNASATRLGTGVADGDGIGSNPGTSSHAAETIACMVCHENNTWYPFAGGFNQTEVYKDTTVPNDEKYYYNHSDGTGGKMAAHNQFIREAIKDPLMTDSNEACIACHTRVGVNITWTKNTVLEFNASEDDLGNWTLTDFVATGDNITYTTYANNWTT